METKSHLVLVIVCSQLKKIKCFPPFGSSKAIVVDINTYWNSISHKKCSFFSRLCRNFLFITRTCCSSNTKHYQFENWSDWHSKFCAISLLFPFKKNKNDISIFEQIVVLDCSSGGSNDLLALEDTITFPIRMIAMVFTTVGGIGKNFVP